MFRPDFTSQAQARVPISEVSSKHPWIKWCACGISCTVFTVGAIRHYRRLNPDIQGREGIKSLVEYSGPNLKSQRSDEFKEEIPAIKSWNGLAFLNSSSPRSAILSTLSSWTWPTTLPFSGLQSQLSALILELGRGPGSLYSEIVLEPPDLSINPECEWDAEVRLGEDLCLSERAFLRERKRAMRAAFAQLMDVSEEQVCEDDLPVVAIAGSGGGYRAMLNTIGSLSGAQETGILDCVTYTAGVSGSCWSIGVIYSGVAGSCNTLDAGQHTKDRIQFGYLDRVTLEALITPPTNKYLLSGLLRKAAGPSGSVSLVDIYGTLIASRIFVSSDMMSLDPRHLSLHSFRRNIDNGAMPLPIFTALQHKEPGAEKAKVKAVVDAGRDQDFEQQDKAKWLWYEFTPFEVGCDKLGAWIPAWALGREFENGKSIDRRPELSFSILAGIFASAFCASLKEYFSEFQPSFRQLPPQLYGWIRDIITENEDDLDSIHPVHPDQLPNFLKGLNGQLREGVPESVTQQETLGFMDAGAELNIPYYPLLRRTVDCIIALDASADSQDLWFTRAEGLAAKRGLRTWPRGVRWPRQVMTPTGETPRKASISASDTDATNVRLARMQESAVAQQVDKQVYWPRDTSTNNISDEQSPQPNPILDTSCEVWIGSSKTSEDDALRMDELDEDALLHRDGIGIVYMPLVPNEKGVPGFDPFSVSTWRRELTPTESQNMLDVAEANFKDGVPKIRKLLRAIWMRKKREREAREAREGHARSKH